MINFTCVHIYICVCVYICMRMHGFSIAVSDSYRKHLKSENKDMLNVTFALWNKDKLNITFALWSLIFSFLLLLMYHFCNFCIPLKIESLTRLIQTSVFSCVDMYTYLWLSSSLEHEASPANGDSFLQLLTSEFLEV